MVKWLVVPTSASEFFLVTIWFFSNMIVPLLWSEQVEGRREKGAGRDRSPGGELQVWLLLATYFILFLYVQDATGVTGERPDRKPIKPMVAGQSRCTATGLMVDLAT